MPGAGGNLREFTYAGDPHSFLLAAFEGGTPGSMLDAIGIGARAFGVSELSTGQRRENSYRKLSAEGNPGFKDVAQILRVMGFD